MKLDFFVAFISVITTVCSNLSEKHLPSSSQLLSDSCPNLHYNHHQVVDFWRLLCDEKFATKMTVSKLVRRLIIMGPPGSGKGTVSGRITKTYNSFHLSSGDLLRAQIAAKTKEGLLAEGYISKGALVPDDVMNSLIVNALKDQEAQMTSGSWLLDGFPRTTAQASSLHKSLPADFVINLDVPFHVIIDRVRGRWVHLPSGRVYNEDWNPPQHPGKDDVTGEPLSKRDDDRPETVDARLMAYQKQTQPVLDFYRHIDPKLVHNFQGTETNVIWPMIKDFLDNENL